MSLPEKVTLRTHSVLHFVIIRDTSWTQGFVRLVKVTGQVKTGNVGVLNLKPFEEEKLFATVFSYIKLSSCER